VHVEESARRTMGGRGRVKRVGAKVGLGSGRGAGWVSLSGKRLFIGGARDCRRRRRCSDREQPHKQIRNRQMTRRVIKSDPSR